MSRARANCWRPSRRRAKSAPARRRADGQVSLLTARCIGACGIAPAVVYDGAIAGKQSVEAALKQMKGWLSMDLGDLQEIVRIRKGRPEGNADPLLHGGGLHVGEFRRREEGARRSRAKRRPERARRSLRRGLHEALQPGAAGPGRSGGPALRKGGSRRSGRHRLRNPRREEQRQERQHQRAFLPPADLGRPGKCRPHRSRPHRIVYCRRWIPGPLPGLAGTLLPCK